MAKNNRKHYAQFHRDARYNNPAPAPPHILEPLPLKEWVFR
jgi:hypothetical protein